MGQSEGTRECIARNFLISSTILLLTAGEKGVLHLRQGFSSSFLRNYFSYLVQISAFCAHPLGGAGTGSRGSGTLGPTLSLQRLAGAESGGADFRWVCLFWFATPIGHWGTLRRCNRCWAFPSTLSSSSARETTALPSASCVLSSSMKKLCQEFPPQLQN